MSETRKFTLLTYLEESKQPGISLIFILPVLLTYEIGVRLLNMGRKVPTVNGADAILKHAFNALGFYGSLLSAICIIITLTLMHMHTKKQWKYHSASLPVMILESILLAIPLFGLDSLLSSALLAIGSGSGLAANMILSLGAGVYEEFLFRLLLLGAMLFFCKTIFKRNSQLSQALCVLTGAIIFAVFHHLGPMGDPFSLRLFAFRTIAGVYFSWVYLSRGFGLAVGCHTCYDLLVITLSLTA